jgi:hypothetical protein
MRSGSARPCAPHVRAVDRQRSDTVLTPEEFVMARSANDLRQSRAAASTLLIVGRKNGRKEERSEAMTNTNSLTTTIDNVRAAVKPKLQLLAFVGFAVCVLLLSEKA